MLIACCACLHVRTITHLIEVLKGNAPEARRLFGQLQHEGDDRVRGACLHTFGKMHACTFLRSFVSAYKRYVLACTESDVSLLLYLPV